jgi:hypothetical protein
MTTPNNGKEGRPDGAALALAKEVENLRRAVEQVRTIAAGAKETAETAVRSAARNVGVGGEVDGLRTQLGEVAVQLITVATAVNGMAGLAQQVARLSDQVTALAQGLGDDEDESPAPAGPALPSWFEVEAEQAQAMLVDLVTWVDTILVRHQAAVDALTECWMLHGEVVEDLLWLKACWTAAHRDPNAKPVWAADWHERWLPGAMGRLKRQLGVAGCNYDSHRDEAGESRIRDERHPQRRVPAIGPDVAGAYARWWAQTRGKTDVVPPGLPERRTQHGRPGSARQPTEWGQP